MEPRHARLRLLLCPLTDFPTQKTYNCQEEPVSQDITRANARQQVCPQASLVICSFLLVFVTDHDESSTGYFVQTRVYDFEERQCRQEPKEVILEQCCKLRSSWDLQMRCCRSWPDGFGNCIRRCQGEETLALRTHIYICDSLPLTHQDAKVEVVLSDASEGALKKGLAFMGMSCDFIEPLSLAKLLL